MKFKDLYPDMTPIFDERKGIIRSYSTDEENCGPAPCHWCKELTEYVEINYEAPFCSEECLLNFEKDIGV